MSIVDVVPDPEVLQPGIRSIIRIAANCIAPNFTNHLIFFPEADQTLYWFVKR